MNLSLATRLTFPVIFGVALATGFSGAVVPGSLLAVVIINSVRFGWVAGPLLMIGHGALEFIAVILLSTGLIRFARSPTARGIIGLIGGLVLVYLGYLTLQIPGTARLWRAPGRAASNWSHLALLGGLMSVANPYWWLWWATIGVAHVGWATQRGRTGGVTYFVGHILSDVSWYCAVSLALAAGRSFLSSAVLKGIYLGCGVFLLALGVIFIVAGAQTLRHCETKREERRV